MNYQTRQVEEQVGSLKLSISCLVDFEASVDELFEELRKNPDFDANAEPSRFESLCPYFGVLWPPARILSEYLVKLGEMVFREKKVLELGCGLALPSLVAASLGAQVTASDWNIDVPVFLERNQRLNGLAPIKYQRADWFADPASIKKLGLFDVIIGSDVLYDPAHPKALCSVIDHHLAPHGFVLIADANRSYAATFAQEMIKRGFDCHLLEQLVTGNLPRQSKAEIVVKIYELHRT